MPKSKPKEERGDKPSNHRILQMVVEHIDVISYAILAVGTIVIIYASVFANVSRDGAVWMNCIGANLMVVGAFIYAQDMLWKKDAEAQTAETTTAEAQPTVALRPEIPPAPSESPKQMVPGNKDIRQFILGSEHLISIYDKIPDKEKEFFLLFGNDLLVQVNGLTMPVIVELPPDGRDRSDLEPMLELEVENEMLWVSAKMFGDNRDILCELDKNEIHTNSDHVFRTIRPSPSQLIVTNKKAQTILDVELLNPRAVRILGSFRLRSGYPITITNEMVKFNMRTLQSGYMSLLPGGSVLVVGADRLPTSP